MKGVSESIRYSGAGLYLGAALLLALLAGFAVYSFLHAAVPNVQVFVVTRDLPPGAKISESDIASKQVPAAAMPDGAVTKKEAIVGQRTRFGLASGDVIRSGHLAPVANSDIPQQVAVMGDTYRAVMIPADLVPGQGRLVAGDRLELLAVLQVQDGPKATSKLVPLGLATVLDTPQNPNSSDKTTILVAMKAEEVSRYALAMRTGSLVVTVPGKEPAEFVPSLKVDDLVGVSPAATPAPGQPQVATQPQGPGQPAGQPAGQPQKTAPGH